MFLRLAAVFGFVGVALGAFGAHGLRARVAPELLAVWQTGVLYHLVHALALFGIGLLASRAPSTATTTAGWAFALGIVVFSGSLYALVLSGVRALGAVTPLGGVAFLVGWAALFVAASSSS